VHGVIAGFAGAWLTNRRVETTVFYCTATNTNPVCVAARNGLEREGTKIAFSTGAMHGGAAAEGTR
jgi:hypothetical protein